MFDPQFHVIYTGISRYLPFWDTSRSGFWLHQQRQGFEATVTCMVTTNGVAMNPKKCGVWYQTTSVFFWGRFFFWGGKGWIIYAKPWSKEMSKYHLLFDPPGVWLKLCEVLMWLRISTIVPSSLHQHRWLCFNHFQPQIDVKLHSGCQCFWNLREYAWIILWLVVLHHTPNIDSGDTILKSEYQALNLDSLSTWPGRPLKEVQPWS